MAVNRTLWSVRQGKSRGGGGWLQVGAVAGPAFTLARGGDRRYTRAMKRMCGRVGLALIIPACLGMAQLAGCSHAPATEADAAAAQTVAAVSAEPVVADVAAAEYDAVFEAAVETLRDMRFEVDRKDRRFGVVTTEPMMAASVAEPWYQDNTTAWQAFEATLHKQRRRVRVELTPATTVPSDNDPAAGDAASGDYQMQVVVDVERQYHPPRPIHTSALARVTYRRADRRYRPVETEAGVEESYWASLGRDERLERRLMEMILRRAQAPETAAAHPQPTR